MKLKLLTITIFLGASLILNAQDDAPAKANVQIGINATSFINTFLSFNENNGNIGAYRFTLKSLKDNKGFRAGIGFGLAKSKTGIDANNEDRVNKNNFINLRLGYEWQVPIHRKWMVYYGLDVLGGFSRFESSFNPGFGDIITKQNSTSVGAGGVLGIQFNINDRISLATESTLYFTHTSIKDEQIFNDPGFGNDTETKSRNDLLNMSLPSSLYFQISF